MKQILNFFAAVLMLLAFANAGYAGAVTDLKAGVNKVMNYGQYPYQANDGYQDAKKVEDNATKNAATEGAFSAGMVGWGVGAAAVNGAGSLAGYAGIASAVSNLGLGSLTTAAAGAMGSSATGAAATALVTGAVGGPVIMGGIIVAGTAAAGYGVYKGGQALWKWVSD